MEKSLKGTKTEQNLLKAFAGESQAKNRYEFAAKVAKEEGFEQISGIFQATALQEQTHAKRFFRFLEGGMVEIIATYPAGKTETTLGLHFPNSGSATHRERNSDVLNERKSKQNGAALGHAATVIESGIRSRASSPRFGEPDVGGKNRQGQRRFRTESVRS